MKIKFDDTIIIYDYYTTSDVNNDGSVEVHFHKDEYWISSYQIENIWTNDRDKIDEILKEFIVNAEEWSIWSVNCFDKGYDTYNGFIVVARNEKEIKELIRESFYYTNIGDFKIVRTPTTAPNKPYCLLDSFSA